MSKAEFARALGWAPSTLSKWETGRAQPSRLALKIILAFGEERGVRYRPHRAALPAPLVHPVEVAPGPVRPASDAPALTIGSDRPRFEAVVNFRVRVDRRKRDPMERRRWLEYVTVAATSCAALLLTLRVLSDGSYSIPIAVAPKSHRIDTPRKSSPPPVASSESAATAGALQDRASAVAPEPRPVEIRLDGVTLLGGVRTGTFRANGDTMTIGEGAQLGERQVVRIHGQGVDLTDTTGALQTVRLGETVALR